MLTEFLKIPGNYYSFANTYHNDARLFFTQGCVPSEGTASKPAVSEQEFATEGPRTKGRGRGKSKAASENKA